MEHVQYYGEDALRAVNGELSFVVVPGWGSNVVSLIDAGTGWDVLRGPDSPEQFLENPALYGMPLLFPPNRIEDGRFSMRGKEYRFPVNEPKHNNHIHGFLHNRPWKVVRVGAEGGCPTLITQFDAADWVDILDYFPHRFVVTMRLTLETRALRTEVTVRNESDEPMPMGLGFHTCFRFPEATSVFSVPVAKQWHLNDRMLPTGVLEETALARRLREGTNLQDYPLDHAFSALIGRPGADGLADGAVLTIPTVGVRVSYRVGAGFAHWVVYNGDGRNGFVCPEPYTWVTNAPRLPLPPEATGWRVLAPGAESTFATAVEISRL